MKKLITLIVALSLLALLAVGISASTKTGTTIIDTSVADPWMFYHDGMYYLVKTGSGGVGIYEGSTLEKLSEDSMDVVYRAAQENKRNTTTNKIAAPAFSTWLDKVVTYNTEDPSIIDKIYYHYDQTSYDLFGENTQINGTWSPEIHYFSEEEFPGNSGWYMFVALRQTLVGNSTGDSANIRMVVLKSTTDSPKGPYGNPITGITNSTSLANENERRIAQPFLNADGTVYNKWGCGQTILRISEGEYAGIYAMWVSEHYRGTADFYQTISIAKLQSPWQLADNNIGTVTSPTQDWEKTGYYAGTTAAPNKWLPDVVEGATPIYGKNGEIFMIYCGGGYWTNGNYALGQLTWNGGNPLDENSWVKLTEAEDKNPIFDANRDSQNLAGAGHASFIQDKDGNGFAIYHAYPYGYWQDTTDRDNDGNKTEYYWGFSSSRRSYIEPYSIDYETGIVKIGNDPDRSPADYVGTEIYFNDDADASYLEAPVANALGGNEITLSLEAKGAEGYAIYRSEDNETFTYLATTMGNTYVDGTAENETYYSYRAYAYREEEISPVSNTVSAIISGNAPEIAGDFHEDGRLSVLDVVSFIKILVSDKNVFSYHDLNRDGKVNASDIVTLIGMVLG